MMKYNQQQSLCIRTLFSRSFFASNSSDSFFDSNGTTKQPKLLWENIVSNEWQKCSLDNALLFLSTKGNEYMMITDAIDNQRVSKGSPAYNVKYQELQEFIFNWGYWNFYFFDKSYSWMVIITDEVEQGFVDGVCFTIDKS